MSFILKRNRTFLSHSSGRTKIRAFQSKNWGYLICSVGFVTDCENIQGWSENLCFSKE